MCACHTFEMQPTMVRLLAAFLGVAVGLAACSAVSPSGPPSAVTRSAVTPAAPTPTAVSPTSAASPVVVDPSVSPPAASPDAKRFLVARSGIRLPTARSRAVAFVLGRALLLCGGLTTAGATTGAIERIDLPSGRVIRVGDLADPVHDAGGAVLNGAGFVVGGGRAGPGAVVQRVGPAGAATAVGQLPAVRADLAAVSVGGELMVVGGGTPARPDRRVLASTDGRHFRIVGKLLVGVRYPAVAVVAGRVYVIGGSTRSGDTRVIQAFDPRTGVVRIVGHLRRGLSHASALVVGGALLVAGGRVAGRAQNGLWRFDVATGAVAPAGRLPYAVSDMAVAVVDGIGYLIGGERFHAVASIITVTTR